MHRLLFLQFRKVKSKVCRLLSANRLPMSLNNFSEIYISHLPASAISLRARSVPLLLLVLLGKRNANERLSLISILENFCQIKNVNGKEKQFNNFVEKNVLRKIDLVSCHTWIACKLLTLRHKKLLSYKVSSVIIHNLLGPQTQKSIQ